MAEVWVAATVAAAGTVGGAMISANASKGAAAANMNAAQSANQTQLAEFQAAAGLQTPGRNLGYGADSLLAQLYGIPDPNAASTTQLYGANQSLNGIGGLPGGVSGGGTANGLIPGQVAATGGTQGKGGSGIPVTSGGGAPSAGARDFSNFFNTPGYQFNLNQGLQTINRQAAANGNLYSTNTLNQLGTYAQGVASNQYNNYVNQLMGLAGIGTGATNATQSAATTAGNNISANQLTAGNANASGILGSAGAFSGALNNVGGILGNYSKLNAYGNTSGYSTSANDMLSGTNAQINSDPSVLALQNYTEP